MILEYGLIEFLSEANNMYDLIGNCFGALCENVSNHQKFISEYIDEGDGQNCNPNIAQLHIFSEKIMEIVKQYEFWNYFSVHEKILGEIDYLELVKYGDDKQNQLTVIYCILEAIDAMAIVWDKNWLSGDLGPLDRQQKTSYRVYFSIGRTIHEEYVKNIDRDRALPSTFFEQFRNFRFIDETKWKEEIEVPRIKYFSLPNNLHLQDEFRVKHKIKIAVIPVSCEKNFSFEPTTGSRIKVDYSENDQIQLGKQVCHAVEAAVLEGSHIIVLPEYIVSPYLYSEIKKQLKACHRDKNKEKIKLLYLFAGTTWSEDNNNIMRILDTWGNQVGEYYKYTPFTKPKEGRHGFTMCEALDYPGKRCDVIAVEDIGILLPAICRDMIDGEYTAELARILLPAFIITAAWSPSVATFEERQRELANKYFVSTVLGNACSAVAIDKKKIGNGSIVQKSKTIAGVQMKEIRRKKFLSMKHKSYLLNRACKGCYFLFDYDFNFVKDKKNTKLQVKKCFIE